MAVVGEIVELLRRWDFWKRVEDAPGRIDALEARVAALEAQSTTAPTPAGAMCPYCETGQMKVEMIAPHPLFGTMGVEERTLVCTSCGKSQVVMHDPNKVAGGPRSRRG